MADSTSTTLITKKRKTTDDDDIDDDIDNAKRKKHTQEPLKKPLIRALYIPAEIHEKYRKIIEDKGKEYEAKNFVPGRVYKVTGASRVDHKMTIRFEKGYPIGAFYDDKKLGPCWPARCYASDIEYGIPTKYQKTFNDLASKIDQFEWIMEDWSSHVGTRGSTRKMVIDMSEDL